MPPRGAFVYTFFSKEQSLINEKFIHILRKLLLLLLAFLFSPFFLTFWRNPRIIFIKCENLLVVRRIFWNIYANNVEVLYLCLSPELKLGFLKNDVWWFLWWNWGEFWKSYQLENFKHWNCQQKTTSKNSVLKLTSVCHFWTFSWIFIQISFPNILLIIIQIPPIRFRLHWKAFTLRRMMSICNVEIVS